MTILALKTSFFESVPFNDAAAVPVPTVGLSFSFALRRFFTITSRQKMRQAEIAAATHPNAAYMPPGSSINRLPHSCSLSSYPDGQLGRPGTHGSKTTVTNLSYVRNGWLLSQSSLKMCSAADLLDGGEGQITRITFNGTPLYTISRLRVLHLEKSSAVGSTGRKLPHVRTNRLRSCCCASMYHGSPSQLASCDRSGKFISSSPPEPRSRNLRRHSGTRMKSYDAWKYTSAKSSEMLSRVTMNVNSSVREFEMKVSGALYVLLVLSQKHPSGIRASGYGTSKMRSSPTRPLESVSDGLHRARPVCPSLSVTHVANSPNDTLNSSTRTCAYTVEEIESPWQRSAFRSGNAHEETFVQACKPLTLSPTDASKRYRQEMFFAPPRPWRNTLRGDWKSPFRLRNTREHRIGSDGSADWSAVVVVKPGSNEEPPPAVDPYAVVEEPLAEDRMLGGEVVRTGTNVPALSQMRVRVIHAGLHRSTVTYPADGGIITTTAARLQYLQVIVSEGNPNQIRRHPVEVVRAGRVRCERMPRAQQMSHPAAS
uniref:Uncharacterized protein n=1 Tax=Anopheles farauti TaxID=69004 RepID=A0A182Q028_9DIPT